MFYKRLGAQLKRRRIEQGLTQEQLAEAADISTAFYGHIERGTRKLSVDTLYKLTKALQCPADDLLGTGYATRKTASALELLALAEQLAVSLEDDLAEAGSALLDLLEME